MRIAIVTPSITTGDAVSNDVLGMHRALSRIGEARIFAEGCSVKAPGIYPVKKIKSFVDKTDDVLIYHYSRGWAPAIPLLKSVKCRKIFKYHNVTPASFFTLFNQDLAQMCAAGRGELDGILTSGCDLFLSASEYNMRELIAAGASESRNFVVPPFHQVDELVQHQPVGTSGEMERNGNVNVCTVGRVAPNKGHAELISAFAIYHHDYNRHSRLTIVGKEELRLARYSAMIRAVVKRMEVEHAVTFAGEVTNDQLNACYNASDVFITTSEHEGFCVPLVEAMAFEVPIVAYATTAVTETVGPAGIVWQERNAALLAESLNAVTGDETLRRTLVAAGRQRYEQRFTTQRITEQLMKALDRL